MPVILEELIDEFHGIYDAPNEEFPWAQQHPFQRALRDVVGPGENAEAVSTTTTAGNRVVLVVSNDEASIVSVTSDGVTTTYVGSLKGGLLHSTIKRVDEFRRETMIRFEHERLPDGGIRDVATERRQLDRQNRLFEMLRPYSVPA